MFKYIDCNVFHQSFLKNEHKTEKQLAQFGTIELNHLKKKPLWYVLKYIRP